VTLPAGPALSAGVTLPAGPALSADEVVADLIALGVRRGDRLAVALSPGVGLGMAIAGADTARELPVPTGRPAVLVAGIEVALRPRWVWWDSGTAAALLADEVRPSTCWDLSAVHRLLFGGWQSDPARIWAALQGLGDESVPKTGQLDLLGSNDDEGSDPEDPARPDGHLRPEWVAGGWSRSVPRLARWAGLAARAAGLQDERLRRIRVRGDSGATARAESTTELLCAELDRIGLPVNRDRAEEIVAGILGPRPRDAEHARSLRRRRDEDVLRHLPGHSLDLRSPVQVKAMLARVGIEVPNTRSWRLEAFRGAHPVVEALLGWRRAERFATTFGYDWLDHSIGPDGRLRGRWTGCDGGAGRMTVQGGLHSLPAELRPAVAAEPGQRLVRADLGQIEPRVLAEISGDPALSAATHDADLYLPVAARLRVERPVAKVAVLAAMYGQTSGAAGEALKGLEVAYPVAMRYLRDANDAGRAARDVRTHGGRLVRMWPTPADLDAQAARAHAAGRGRYARNAVVQGSAAEFFKAWAVTVRAAVLAADARIVLCLHDELLIESPSDRATEVAELVQTSLQRAARWWAPSGAVRFAADISTIDRWSEAKT